MILPVSIRETFRKRGSTNLTYRHGFLKRNSALSNGHWAMNFRQLIEVRSLLSVVRCQLKKIRVNSRDTWKRLCVFANFARGKPKFARKSFGGIKKFLYFCNCIFSDIKKRFCLFLVSWNLENFKLYANKISGKRPREYRGLFLFWHIGISRTSRYDKRGPRLF